MYGKGRARYQTGWIFGKVPKGGVIFNPKIYVADIGNPKQGFLSMKLIQKINFRVQGMFFQQTYWEQSKQDTLSKNEGGVKGSLEFFQKIIRFGSPNRPLVMF